MERNHIRPTPGPYRPPEGVLRRCRLIDPDVDLHYVGEGRWALGSVVNNAVRRGIAGRIKRRLEKQGARTPGQYWLAKLHYRGFGVIGLYDWSDLYRIPADFARKDHNYRQGRERAFRQAEAASQGVQERRDLDDLLEEVELRHRDEAPRLFRGRTHSIPA